LPQTIYASNLETRSLIHHCNYRPILSTAVRFAAANFHFHVVVFVSQGRVNVFIVWITSLQPLRSRSICDIEIWRRRIIITFFDSKHRTDRLK